MRKDSLDCLEKSRQAIYTCNQDVLYTAVFESVKDGEPEGTLHIKKCPLGVCKDGWI